jgi:hypothetical protein
MSEKKIFQPFVSPQTIMKELTVKSILLGSLFGVIFGAATVYLALKAGLTVSASIPIAVSFLRPPSLKIILFKLQAVREKVLHPVLLLLYRVFFFFLLPTALLILIT